jgi:hypothetical protein
MIETPEANLTKGMRHLNGVFTQWSNRRHKRSGHLFQGRYKAILVDRQKARFSGLFSFRLVTVVLRFVT